MRILHLLSRYKLLRFGLFYLSWPVLWFVAPLFLRARVAIINKSNDVLLVKHSFGADGWMLPGGGVKLTETPIKAAIREVQEELGITIENNNLKKCNEEAKIWSTKGLLFRVIIFSIDGHSLNSSDITPSSEIREFKWFAADSLEVQQALPRDIAL